MNQDNHSLILLVTGKCPQTEKLSPLDAADVAINIFTASAQKTPQELLKSIKDTIEVKIDGMTMVALAIFTAKANKTFLQKDTTSTTMAMLFSVYGPPKLLEFVELLKSKSFGRGLGARPQKWVRSAMEAWSHTTLKKYSLKHPRELYSLIMLIHPRYQDNRGILIREFLGGSIKK